MLLGKSKNLPFAITMGDPTGIGPEITQKAWQVLRDSDMPFFVIADPQYYSNIAIIEQPSEAHDRFKNALPLLPVDCPNVKIGTLNPEAARPIIRSIDMGVKFVQKGLAGALITNPISKDVLYKSGFTHPGHTEYLAHLTGTPKPIMMLCAQDLRVALASIHIPLADVPTAISQDIIIETATIVNNALKRDFGIKAPRIAMAGLNPHAGENGALGKQELAIQNPAAAILRQRGIDISDARSADTLFHAEARLGYDVVLAMYHDQGLIPVKTLDFHAGVNITLGLPIIRTSPDHGTGFDIATKGVARADSLIQAIKTAREMMVCRARNGVDLCASH